jgi:hypothetical protein
MKNSFKIVLDWPATLDKMVPLKQNAIKARENRAMTTSTLTPAQEKGFIEDVTRLRLVGEGYSEALRDLVFILIDDDKSRLPFFKSECGTVGCKCFLIEDLEIIPEQPRVAIAVDSPQVPLPVPMLPPESVAAMMATDYRKVLPTPARSPWPGEVIYTPLQKNAVDTFEAMLEAVTLYRAAPIANPRPNGLTYSYGICDNIETFARKAGADYSQMAWVKENLIRRVPSYSGEYHYPVKGVNGQSPTESFGSITDKWGGEYGANRMLQLGELVHAIKTEWDDSLVGSLTPCRRMGYKVGDIFQYKDDGELYVLNYDDDSSSPGFGPIGSDISVYSWKDIDKMTKMPVEALPQLQVSEYLEKIKALELQKAEIQRTIAEQSRLLKEVASQINLNDFYLAKQHGVKRI